MKDHDHRRPARAPARRRPLLALAIWLSCVPGTRSPDAGRPEGPFASPQGIAATTRYALVVSSAFHFEEGRPVYARGWVTVLDRRSRRPLGQLATSGVNPQSIAVHGEQAYVVSSGALQLDSAGLATPAGDGALDRFDLSGGVPAGPGASLRLPRGSNDPRVGGYGAITLSEDGRRAFIGSGTRGDLFVVDLEGGLRLRRGPEDPLVLFPTAPGKNGLTTPVTLAGTLAVLDFNSDALCLIADPGGALASRRCEGVGLYPDLLEGPLSLAAEPGGKLLVLMSVANRLYRIDPSRRPITVEGGFAATGLSANRVLTRMGHAFIVNSLSNNLQRVELESGRSTLPFAVLPVASNPYDLCITEEPDGARAWVTLQASNQVAVVDLGSGALIELLPAAGDRDAGSPDGGRREGGACLDGASQPVLGIGNIVELKLGPGGGAGQDRLPGILRGGPAAPGSTDDHLSLGVGGEIVVDFGDWEIVDGPGPDFIVFENPFLVGAYQPYAEPAVVGLGTAEPSSYLEFACDLGRTTGDPQAKTWPYPGCAGVRPVLAGAGSCVAPTDAALAGGDGFDLAELGLSRARTLRLRDAGVSTMGETTKGFDLDAVVLIHYSRR